MAKPLRCRFRFDAGRIARTLEPETATKSASAAMPTATDVGRRPGAGAAGVAGVGFG